MTDTNVDDWTFRRGSKIFSIFGQIEAVVAEAMIKEGKGIRIAREDFPSATLCPDVHRDAEGRLAQFAIMLPMQRVREFEDRVAALRL